MSLSYINFVGASQKKKKSNRPLNPKPFGVRRMLFLVLQKVGREWFAGIHLSSSTPLDSDTDLTVPFAEDSTEEEEQDADCVFRTGRFSEDHNVEEWIRCAKYFRWAHTLFWYGGRFCL